MDSHHTFASWIKTQKILVTWVLFLILMAYGVKVFNYNISIDTDIMIYNAMGNLKAYIGSRRFSVSFTKMLLSTEVVNPYLLNFLMVSILSAAAFVWCYVLNMLSGKSNPISNCVFSGIFLTHPLMAEQFEFTLQGTEVALALLLMAFSVYFVHRYLILNAQKRYLFVGVLLMVWCFGTYQSFFVIYIVGCVFTIIFSLCRKSQSNLYWLKIIMSEIFILIVSAILYFMVSSAVIFLFDAQHSYIDSMIMWKTRPIGDCLKNIAIFLRTVILGEGTFYNKMYIFFISLLIIHFIRYVKNKGVNKIIYLICWIGVCVSPFMMSIILGNQEPKRAQFYLPFMLALGFYYLSLQITRREIYVLLCSVCLVCSFRQGVVTSRLFYTDFLRFEEDQELVYSMSQKMGELGFLNGERKYIVFIGGYNARLNNSAECGQIIGQSRFHSGGTATGATPWAISIFRVWGYDFWTPEAEQYEKALEWSKTMTCWPEDGSICCRDGIIVVKLSEIE